MIRLFPMLTPLGCATTYTQTFEHGGELSLRLAPVTDGDGISVDVTLPGLGQAAVDAVPEQDGGQAIACPAPYLTYATNTLTEEPIYGILVGCAHQVDLGGSCAGPVSMGFELEGDRGAAFLELDPIGDDAPAGDQFWISGDLAVADPMIGKSGSLQATVSVDDGCMTEPVDHTLELTWDFPLTTVVETSTPFDWSTKLGD